MVYMTVLVDLLRIELVLRSYRFHGEFVVVAIHIFVTWICGTVFVVLVHKCIPDSVLHYFQENKSTIAFFPDFW